MNTQNYGSVVAMEFRSRPSIDFADIVEEFDIAFQMVDSRTRSLTWDCDDIAIIDRDFVRVALGWLPAKSEGDRWHLVIAVGAAPNEDLSKIDKSSFGFLADLIVDRTNEYLPSTAVLHGAANQPVGPELIDSIFELLRMDATDMNGDTAKTKARRRTTRIGEIYEDYADMVDSMAPPWAHSPKHEAMYGKPGQDNAAQDPEAGPAPGQMLLTRSEPTEPLRLTIHTLALSLFLYAPALGAFLFAYSMLRDISPIASQAV